MARDPRLAADAAVVAHARRRQFSNADKRRILEAADRCTLPGEVGALRRCEGVYSSLLSPWRQQRETADLASLASKKRGPKVDPQRAETLHIAQLTRGRDKFKSRLDKALLVIADPKKLAALLGNPTGSIDFIDPPMTFPDALTGLTWFARPPSLAPARWSTWSRGSVPVDPLDPLDPASRAGLR